MKTRLQPVFGIPVLYDDTFHSFTQCRGFWPFKRIVVGRSFMLLNSREKTALVLHEIAHAKLLHAEQRILCALITPWQLKRLGREQEFQADDYARASGYGRDLAFFFARIREEPSFWHPPKKDRIERLCQMPPQVAI